MDVETLFSSYRIVDQYMRLISMVNEDARPEIRIRAIDAYLMKQVAAFYPVTPTVIDFAADQTLGASAVLWTSAYPRIRKVIAPKRNGQAEPLIDWRCLLSDNFSELGLNSAAVTLTATIEDQTSDWISLVRNGNRDAPLIITFSAIEGAVESLSSQLQDMLRLSTNTLIFLLPLGAIGQDTLLESAFGLCQSNSQHQLVVFRDLAPHFAISQLGLIFDRNNDFIVPILQRIRQTFSGNFGFLQLIEDNTKLKLRVQQLEAENSLRTSNATPERVAVLEAAPQIEKVQPGSVQAPTPIIAAPNTQQQMMGKLGLKLAKMGLPTLGRLMLPAGHLSYKVDYLECSVPHDMQVGEVYESRVRLRNADTGVWITSKQAENGVNMSYHWYTSDGKLIIKEGLRTVLAETMQPGEVADVSFQVIAPDQAGQYMLQPDLVHEGVMWFSEAKAPGPSYKVDVH